MGCYPTPKPAVKIAIAVLVDTLAADDLGVGSKMPKRWPDKFIRVTRAGGGLSNVVTDTARILCECYGATIAVVEELTGQAIAALQNAEGRVVMADTPDDDAFVRGFNNIEGPTDFPHPDVPDMCRWQFQGDLLVSTG